MAKKVTRKKSKASLQKEIAKLKKLKKEAKDRKALLAARAKQIKEINELRREARELKGIGTKRRLAGKISKRLAKDAGKYGWKGLKIAGKIGKAAIEAQQENNPRSKPKPKRRKKR